MLKNFIVKKSLVKKLRITRNQLCDLLNRTEDFQEQTYLQGRIDAIELLIMQLNQN